ncbi:MAG: hypothetical protein EXR27_17490 [Betaproteobacteria bacterium]|nr:hypothetical protein [Betaproteobacteria bacterium]
MLFLADNWHLAINPYLFSRLPCDPVKNFAPVSRFASSPFFLKVQPSSHVNTLPELVARARAIRGQLNYGSSGSAASTMSLRSPSKQRYVSKSCTYPAKGRPVECSRLLVVRSRFRLSSSPIPARPRPTPTAFVVPSRNSRWR